MADEKTQDLVSKADKPKAPEKSAHQLEIERLELEAKQLEVELKKADLIDVRERLAERAIKRETIGERSRINGNTLRQLKQADEARQKRCNHKKGGNGAEGVVLGRGDD